MLEVSSGDDPSQHEVMKNVVPIEQRFKDLSDQAMIQIMANENLEVWRTEANVIRETVRVAKEYLEFGGYPPNLRKHDYPIIGQTAIANFLGGVWNTSYGHVLIKEALAELREWGGFSPAVLSFTCV